MVTLPTAEQIYKKLTILNMVKMLDNNTPFSFSRYGDSEWRAALNYKEGQFKSSTHDYDQNLNFDIQNSLMKKNKGNNLYYGIPRHCITEFKEEIEKKLINLSDIDWVDANVFYFAAEADNELNSFVKALRKKRVCLVGPIHLAPLKFLTSSGHIIIPSRNAYKKIGKIAISMFKQKNTTDVYILCASLASNILIHFIYPVLGKTHFLIDCGSIWDPHVGILSRKRYEKFNYPKNFVKRNLAE